MSERTATLGNVGYFARRGYWRSALIRARCAVVGHRYDQPGLLQECARCEWARENPRPTDADLRATEASIERYDLTELQAAILREAVSTHSERTA